MTLRFLPSSVVLAIFFLDRVTKYLIQKKMVYGGSINLLPFFHITYVENTGAAFGLGQNQNTFFIVTAIAILIVLFILDWRVQKENLRLKIGIALVIGGALGNLYYRIAYGSVVDFLDFFIATRHWPAFNLADSSICIGAALLVFSQWKIEEGKKL